MGKTIVLTEAQFRDCMKKIKESTQIDNDRFLDVEEVDALLHKMIDYEFMLYFPKYGKRFNCAYIHEKGEIFDAVCSGHPRVNRKGLIVLMNDKYGEFYMDNLIKAKL